MSDSLSPRINRIARAIITLSFSVILNWSFIRALDNEARSFSGFIAFIVAIVYFFVFLGDSFQYQKRYRIIEYIPSALSLFSTLAVVAILGFYKLLDSSPVIMRCVEVNGDYYHKKIEFREDNTYKVYDHQAYNTICYRGHYSLKDSLVTLDDVQKKTGHTFVIRTGYEYIDWIDSLQRVDTLWLKYLLEKDVMLEPSPYGKRYVIREGDFPHNK